MGLWYQVALQYDASKKKDEAQAFGKADRFFRVDCEMSLLWLPQSLSVWELKAIVTGQINLMYIK